MISANTGWYLWNFRRDLIKQLRTRGYEVTIVAPRDNYLIRFQEDGFRTINLSIAGRGINILKELLTVFTYFYHLVKVKPDLYLGFTVKPVLYGGFASRLVGVESVATITGLGVVFVKESTVTVIVKLLYRFVLRSAKKVIFQNDTDLKFFCKEGLVQEEQILKVPGSGVNLTRFAFVESPLRDPVSGFKFLTLARLLKDKGIYELASAAQDIKNNFPATEFLLAGTADATVRDAIPLSLVKEWSDSGLIKYLGLVDDVAPLIIDADCVILPSYREGLSRTLLEAAAIGRASITTDVPGCRDVVIDNETGLLCEAKNASDLTQKINQFICMSIGERSNMGRAARVRAEQYFSETIVIETYLNVIDKKEPQI